MKNLYSQFKKAPRYSIKWKNYFQIYEKLLKRFQNKKSNEDPSELKKYIEKQNSSAKNNLLKSYDLLLNEKYNVVLNQKTIERVKNFFQ